MVSDQPVAQSFPFLETLRLVAYPVRKMVATASGFLTVGLWPGEKPTVNQRGVDRGYHCPASRLAENQGGNWRYRSPRRFARREM